MFTSRRAVTIILAILVVIIQYPLWIGKGGWLRVWSLNNQLESIEHHNEELKARNERLASDVRSLQEGNEAIEERARSELAMVKRGEIFIQLINVKNSPVSDKDLEKNDHSDQSH